MKPIRMLVAAVVAGTVVFVWGAVSHMVLPIGEMGVQNLPDYEAFTPVIREHIKEPGLYFFPPLENDSKEAMEEMTRRVQEGPSGIMIVNPGQGPDQMMPPSMLLIEWGANVLASLVLVPLLTSMRGPVLQRALVGTAMGLFAWLSIDVSYWNWYSFPTAQTVGELIDQVVGWTLAGLVIALMIRKKSATAG